MVVGRELSSPLLQGIHVWLQSGCSCFLELFPRQQEKGKIVHAASFMHHPEALASVRFPKLHQVTVLTYEGGWEISCVPD